MKSRTYGRRPFVTSVVTAAMLCAVVGSVVCAANVHGQTLFARPDTTPNYASKYQHIEDCWTAALRVEREYNRLHGQKIWLDTVEAWTRKDRPKEEWWAKRRSEPAIQAIHACLTKFNPDTATFLSRYSALTIVRILLVAHRDEDVHRFAQRALDSIRKKSQNEYKTMLTGLIKEYGIALPIRYDDVKQYYTRFMVEREPGDSLYLAIDAALNFGLFADIANDTAAGDRARQLALALNDSTPEDERRKSPSAGVRLQWLAGIVAENTQDEGLDSLTKSNLAYELWWANTVKHRVYGGDSVTRAEAADALEKRKMPQIQGEHYYVASVSTSPATSPVTSSGAATPVVVTYASKGALPQGTLPVKHTINYVFSFPTFCHTETIERRPDRSERIQFMNGCLSYFAKLRNLKHEFPDLEFIAMSRTYGTVGQLGPLTLAEEADTLAKLLAFHRMPAHLVVEDTKFYNMAAPDGRRVDIVTPNTEACIEVGGCGGFVDKDGYQITAYRPNDEAWVRRFYEILKNRPSQ